MPWVERIVQVGMRGIGGSHESDLQYARRWGMHIIPAANVRWHGIAPLFDCIPNDARCVVTIDCDVLDPSVLPAVLRAAAGWLELYGCCRISWMVSQPRHGFAGFDLVELVPSRDLNEIGALTAARLICKAPVFRRSLHRATAHP